jgi:hypothetical protein
MEKVQYPYPIDTYLVDSESFKGFVSEEGESEKWLHIDLKKGVDVNIVNAQSRLIMEAIGAHQRFYYSFSRNAFYVENS